MQGQEVSATLSGICYPKTLFLVGTWVCHQFWIRFQLLERFCQGDDEDEWWEDLVKKAQYKGAFGVDFGETFG